MTRVKRGSVARNRRKKLLHSMRGAKGAHSILFRISNQQRRKGLRYAYVGRKCKKRVIRQQWIIRLNALVHLYGMTYSDFIHLVKSNGLLLNRKMIAQLVITNKEDLIPLIRHIEN